jgi:hypothetical protein
MFWKIYFWMLAVQLVGVFVDRFLMGNTRVEGGKVFFEIFNWLVLVGGVIGMYGYVYSKSLGSLLNRREGAIFFIGFVSFYELLFIIKSPEEEVRLLGGLLLLFTIPQFIGLYRYGQGLDQHGIRKSY